MENIAKEYLKLYHDPEKAKQVYTYANMDDYINEQFKTYNKIREGVENSGKEIDFFRYLGLIKNPYLLGLSLAFQTHDYELLNDSIYHYSKHRLLDLSADGYDHSGEFWEVMDAMACNYKDVMEACFPEKLGLCKNGYPAFVVASNLLMALWYQNKDWMDVAYPAGVKLLGQKKALWEKSIVAYLMALADKDIDQASEMLRNICTYSRRIDRPTLYKCLCTEVHGLYQIARYVLPEDDFKRIELPSNKNFCSGLVSWQKEHGFPEKGKMIVNYPDKLDFMNRILELPLPQCVLSGSGKRQVKDVDEMKKKLTKEFPIDI